MNSKTKLVLAFGILISLAGSKVIAQEATTLSANPTNATTCSVPTTYQSLTQSLWTKNAQDNGTLTFETGGKATLTCTAGSARCVVRTGASEEMTGDFRISIDIDSYTATYDAGESFVFIMNLTSDVVPYSYRISAHKNAKGTYITYNPTLNSKSYVAEPIKTLTSLNNLKLIVERKGSTISGYYSQGGEEILISSVNAYPTDVGFYPSLVISNSPGSDPATIFDTMQVKIGNLKAECLVDSSVATDNSNDAVTSTTGSNDTTNQELQSQLTTNKNLSTFMIVVIALAAFIGIVNLVSILLRVSKSKGNLPQKFE